MSTSRRRISPTIAANIATCPSWCGSSKRMAGWCRSGSCAPAISPARWARRTIPNGKLSPLTNFRTRSWRRRAPSAFAGARRASGIWRRKTARPRRPAPLCAGRKSAMQFADVAFPYFGGREHDYFAGTDHPDVLMRQVPVSACSLTGRRGLCRHRIRSLMANYGVDRGLAARMSPRASTTIVPYTPAWQERITGVKRDHVISVARAFARNAEKTKGKSMVILGAGINHWYHMDMTYRGIINMLVMCGCVGQAGGGWAHYVGQEKLRPQTGWMPLAFALDWARPPRHMNATSYFYAHTDQWRYETLTLAKFSPRPRRPGEWKGSLIDFNVRAERMGWLPSAPQLQTKPLSIAGRRPQSAGGSEGLRRRRAQDRGGLRNSPATIPTIRPTGRATCSSGAPISWVPRQGARIFPEASARHPAWRAGQGSWAAPASRSRRKSSGMRTRRRESSTCW